jgi:hypothetical protein
MRLVIPFLQGDDCDYDISLKERNGDPLLSLFDFSNLSVSIVEPDLGMGGPNIIFLKKLLY